MADNFGLKIGLEGEKEFKEALKDINQSFKVLGSEMNLVASEFEKNDKSIQAITSRNQVLKSQLYRKPWVVSICGSQTPRVKSRRYHKRSVVSI